MTATVTGRRSALPRLAVGLAIVVGLVALAASVCVVPAGYRGVVFSDFRGGVRPYSLREGMSLLVPFVEHPMLYEVRSRTYVFSSSELGEAQLRAGEVSAKTSDAQAVYVDLTIRYHPNPKQVHRLHQQVGTQYEEKIVKPNTNGTARSVVAGYTAEEVFASKRQEIEDALKARLSQVFAQYYIVLDDALIRNVRFSPEYHQAIEQKQIAQQRAQRKKYELQRERKDKVRKIIEARGQATAIEIRGQSLAQNPSVVEYQYIEDLPPGTPVYVISGNSIVNMSDMFRSQPEPTKPAQAR